MNRWSVNLMPRLEPPDIAISPLARRYLVSPNSSFGIAGPLLIIGGLSHLVSLVAFIIHNARTGYSDLSMLGKISFYMWWISLSFPIILIVFGFATGGLILGIGYLMFGRREKLVDFVVRVMIYDHSEFVAWAIGLEILHVMVVHLISPLVAWVLFLCDTDDRPYRTVDLLFIVSAGLYFFFMFSMVVVVIGWNYIARRLWIASHATNLMLAFSSPWKVASWRSAFSQGDWPANVIMLLRIDKPIRFLADKWAKAFRH